MEHSSCFCSTKDLGLSTLLFYLGLSTHATTYKTSLIPDNGQGCINGLIKGVSNLNYSFTAKTGKTITSDNVRSVEEGNNTK